MEAVASFLPCHVVRAWTSLVQDQNIQHSFAESFILQLKRYDFKVQVNIYRCRITSIAMPEGMASMSWGALLSIILNIQNPKYCPSTSIPISMDILAQEWCLTNLGILYHIVMSKMGPSLPMRWLLSHLLGPSERHEGQYHSHSIVARGGGQSLPDWNHSLYLIQLACCWARILYVWACDFWASLKLAALQRTADPFHTRVPAGDKWNDECHLWASRPSELVLQVYFTRFRILLQNEIMC